MHPVSPQSQFAWLRAQCNVNEAQPFGLGCTLIISLDEAINFSVCLSCTASAVSVSVLDRGGSGRRHNEQARSSSVSV